MTFVLRMAVREIRASWQRLLFFFVCIAVGVASIVAIRSVIQSVRQGLTREARAMTGADVVVRSDRPLGEAIRDGGRARARDGTRRRRVRSRRAGDDGTAGGRRDYAHGRTAGGGAGISALRDDDLAGTAVLARAAARPRRARASRAPGAAQPAPGRRSAHRQRAFPDPRRDSKRARAQSRRVLARLARVHRSRGSAVDRDCCRSAAGRPTSFCSRCRVHRRCPGGGTRAWCSRTSCRRHS